ncbi:MAG: glycosyl transferase [Xanthobacteraceae bacterium]
MTKTTENWHFWVVFAPCVILAAALISAGLIVLLRPWLLRYALARPNARSSHTTPTPQGGGMAVVAATILVVAIAMLAIPALSAQAETALARVVAGTALLAITGAMDDIRGVDPAPRLLLQLVAVLLAVTSMPSDMRVLPFVPFWVERILIVVGGLWFVNLVNFMDGVDWMTAAEVVPITAGLCLLGAAGALSAIDIVFALALLGAMLGFAPFNRPVAKLFLGDVGSLPIGLLLGWLLVVLAGRGHLAAAVLLPLYYLADATITLGRRLVRHEKVWVAHRTHFYQRAIDRGLTVPEVLARVFAANIVLAGLALATVLFSGLPTTIAAMALGAGVVTLLLVDFMRVDRGRSASHQP